MQFIKRILRSIGKRASLVGIINGKDNAGGERDFLNDEKVTSLEETIKEKINFDVPKEYAQRTNPFDDYKDKINSNPLFRSPFFSSDEKLSVARKIYAEDTPNGESGSHRRVHSSLEKYAHDMAKVYNNSILEGEDHYGALRVVVENGSNTKAFKKITSDKYSPIKKSGEAYQILKIAQMLGEKVVIKRWDSSVVENELVREYVNVINDILKEENLLMKDRYKIINEGVERLFKHSISSRTIRKNYLNADYK